MFEITPDQFNLAAPLLQATSYGSLAAGTLNGSHPGRVFVDHLPVPRSALVCTRAGMGYYFAAGDPAEDFVSALPEQFERDYLPAQKSAQNNPEILIFYPHEGWKEPLFELFGRRNPILIHKKRMVLNQAAVQAGFETSEPLPGGLILHGYTHDLFGLHPPLAEEAEFLYGSTARFLEAGLGICLLDGETVASQCSSVFTGAGEVEISITTAPEFRGRGLAKICARAFIQASLARGLNPIWGCWPENTPSVSLAASLGYVDDVDQPVCFWMDMENTQS